MYSVSIKQSPYSDHLCHLCHLFYFVFCYQTNDFYTNIDFNEVDIRIYLTEKVILTEVARRR